MKRLLSTLFGLGLMMVGPGVLAQAVTLRQAIDMSLAADPRIKEQEKLTEQAKALLAEAQSSGGWRVDLNAFIGFSPKVSGGFYENGATAGGTPRSDGRKINGLSDWSMVQFAVVKPLYTFGKVEHYSDAARGNVDVKAGEIRVQRANTVYDVKRAYYGYLTARDVRMVLEEVLGRVQEALVQTEMRLKQDKGEATLSDQYALQANEGLLKKYLGQAQAVERISLDGLKVLTGTGPAAKLTVVDTAIVPVDLPTAALADLQAKALADRPEMAQLEAGLRARRALVEAKQSEKYPDIYAGVIGTASYSSRRDKLNNPYAYDPFNTVGATPVLGIKWESVFDVAPARVAQAQAELEALNHKHQFAQAGIPFEVADAYLNATKLHQAQLDLAKGAQAARRWMISSYANYVAGLEKADHVAEALKSYTLLQTEYLRTVNDYNMYVAQLARVTGSDR